MKPTEKSPAIDQALTDIFGIDRKGSIEANKCSWCNAEVDESEFRNAVSVREYQISGFCMKCQDKAFGVD